MGGALAGQNQPMHWCTFECDHGGPASLVLLPSEVIMLQFADTYATALIPSRRLLGWVA